MLLAIDPGADAGWSLFAGGKLAACGLHPKQPAPASRATSALIERPKIYPPPRQKARPRDVITLALRAGDWAGRIFEVSGGRVVAQYVEPDEWKGGPVKKENHHPRIWARLDPAEQAIVSDAARGIAPSKRHNIMDAVGLGLYAVGRKA